MTQGHHRFPQAGGPYHPAEAPRRFGLALVLVAVAGYAWYRLTDTGAELLALFSWAHPGADEPRTTWELAPVAVTMSLLIALVPAAAALGAAALGRFKHTPAISGLALAAFTATTLAFWLLAR